MSNRRFAAGDEHIYSIGFFEDERDPQIEQSVAFEKRTEVFINQLERLVMRRTEP